MTTVIIPPTSFPTEAAYPADGDCAMGDMNDVEQLTGQGSWGFGESLRPGDTVMIQRFLTDDTGACRASGEANVFVSGMGQQVQIGTLNNPNENLVTFTLEDLHFQDP